METVECEAFLGGTKIVAREKLSFRPGAYALIVDDGKILLMRNRRTGKYALPGGGVELGERLEDALLRETQEEAGIRVKVDEFLFWREKLFYYDPLDLAFHSFQFFYRCLPLTFDLVADELVQDEEAELPRWIAMADVKAHEFQVFGEEIVEQLRRFAHG